MASRSGTTLGGGRYHVLEHLGSGGMATVYRGIHLELGLQVAIKFLQSREVSEATSLRFRQEARAAAALDHPSCVRVLDFGRAPGGEHYLVMELLGGPTLRAVLDQGPLPGANAVAIALHVLDALEHAHQHGILHRDVKPANVMYGRRSDARVPILIDFGLAKPVTLAVGTMRDGETMPFAATLRWRGILPATETAPGVCCGSPSYVAPERLLRLPYGPAADVYSVGVMMFEMLTGRTPFIGQSAGAIALAALHHDAPPLRSIAPDVSPALARVVERALAKAPERRYPSAAAMAIALSEAAMSAAA